jgi:hypothetical protein
MRFVATLVLMLLAAPAFARVPVRVSTEVRPDTVLVGQTVTLRWRAWLPDKSILTFPARPADDSTTHWRRWETSTLKATASGLREHRLTAELQSFALGPVAVSGAPFRFRVPGERVREGRFPMALFVVGMTVPLDGPEPPLRDMKELVPAPWWARVPWLWIGLGIALALLLSWLWRRLRKRVRPAATPREVALDPPAVEAKKRLAALVARRLPEQGKTLEHGTELADLLRRFVERRFETPRPGYTTSELVRHLRARGDGAPDDVAAFQAILEACDLTKFARRPYDAVRAHEAEDVAARLIEHWAPPPAAVAPAPVAKAGGAR